MCVTWAPEADLRSPKRQSGRPTSGAAQARDETENVFVLPTFALAGTWTPASIGPVGASSALSVRTIWELARFQTATARLVPSRATRGSELEGSPIRTGGCQAPPAGRSAARIAPVVPFGQTTTAFPAGFIASRAPAGATFVATVAGADHVPVERERPDALSDVPSSQTAATLPASLTAA